MRPQKAISYGDIIPGSAFIHALVVQGTISKTAAGRLKWIDFYRSSGNIRLTCRHFNISPTTLHLTTLDQSRSRESEEVHDLIANTDPTAK
jgi:hypothetical protein